MYISEEDLQNKKSKRNYS